jgi:Uri superfamily endonuclease
METKICKKCKEEKEICEFYKDKTKIDGLYSSCKSCKNKYFEKNENKIKQYLKVWRKNNKDNSKKYREKNPDYVKNYYKKNKNKMIISVKKHYDKNKESILKKVRVRSKEYIKNRLKEDSLFHMCYLVRNRVRNFLKSKKINKKNKTFDIVGCSPDFLKTHLENQFVNGMSWENKNKWHIDHIIPLSSAKTEEEIYKLCHYTNLQPLWAEDNLKKSNKILI